MAKSKTEYRALRKAGLCTSCPKGKEREVEDNKHRCAKCLSKLRLWANSAEQRTRKRTWHRRWLKANRDKANKAQRRCRKEAKRKALEGYGGRCACCGERHLCFLTIDHKKGNGAAHRKVRGSFDTYKFYVWLIRNSFPKDYQALCYNCNCAKGTKKHCPHFYIRRKTQG